MDAGAHTVTTGTLASWLEHMLLIRRVEEVVLELLEDGQVPGFPTQYIGQEATAVGALTAVPSGATVFTTHRNRGHVLVRGADPAAVLAEVMCRATGACGGRGGAMHVSAPDVGIPYTSAIVAGSIPVAAGCALAEKQRDRGGLVAACFGDGCLEEGAFAETVNLAGLWKLPLLMICENNSLEAYGTRALEYPASELAAKQVVDVPAAFGLATWVVDGGDAMAVNGAAVAAVAHVKSGAGPAFIEARTVRWPGNRLLCPRLVTGETFVEYARDTSGLTPEQTKWFAEEDPVLRFIRRALDEGALSFETIRQIDRDVRARVEWARDEALRAPAPHPASALDHVLAETG